MDDEDIENVVIDALAKDKNLVDLLKGLQAIDTGERVFIVLNGGEKEDDFSVLILDATTEENNDNKEEDYNRPHICTVVSAGILDILNTSCEEIIERGFNYIKNLKQKELDASKRNNIISLDEYKKAIKTDYTIPITVTKNVQDNQLEINFSVKDKPDNVGEEGDDDYAS